MLRRTALVLLAFLSSLPATTSARTRPDEPFFPDGIPTVDESASPDVGIRCIAPEPGDRREAIPSVEQIRALQAQGRLPSGGVIPVAFHVISDNKGVGDIPEAWLDAQIEVLNLAYSGRDYEGNPVPGAANTGYTFYKASVDRTRSNAWFKMTPGSNAEYRAKLKLGVSTATTLNFYTAEMGFGISGWSTFPQWFVLPYGSIFDGVVVHWSLMPGGPVTNYSHGGTGVHEVGHWVGLFHTFQFAEFGVQFGCGAASEPECYFSGDEVCDTPPQAEPNRGCPEGTDTCPAEGLDPIHNFMNYTYDGCKNQFTPGQDARMDYMMATYRPAIGAARHQAVAGAAPVPAFVVHAPGIVGPEASIRVTPNPFNPRTKIVVDVPVDGVATLRVVDVAGRVVATLADNILLSRGRHEYPFDGRGLASGVYVVSLRQAGTAATMGRLLLLK